MSTNASPERDVHLLLAADEPRGRPLLEDGLEPPAPEHGERPDVELPREDDEFLSAPDEAPEALDRQGWGLIVPEGAAGDRLLEAVRPLSRLRASQQGREPPVYRVPAGGCETMSEALGWCREVYERHPLHERAAYQLILGDLDVVPLAVQQVQSTRGYVGRLAFTDSHGGPGLAGYESYAAKVLRWDGRAAPELRGQLRLHVVSDGSAAVRCGTAELVTPALDALQSAHARPGARFRTTEAELSGLNVPPDPQAFLDAARTGGPAVLFSLSHGLGAPAPGWASAATQRERQGAMSFGAFGAVSAADVAEGAFLSGGLWCMFACLSAGTPARSPYFHWLERLQGMGGFAGDLQAVVASLPEDGRPFVASLPQAALRNPDGPLGFLGHVDLAWTYSFRDASSRGSRSDRFSDALTTWAKARRGGQAAASLAREFASTNGELTACMDRLARTGAKASAADELRRGRLWMQRNDLAGFVFLGDPAVRLPLGTPGAVASLDEGRLDAVERAIARVILGERSLDESAADAGLEPAQLEGLVAAYRSGGRRGIGCQ